MSLWPLPIEVETRLFTDSSYVTSIQSSLFLFRPEFPLIYARVKQLRGDIEEAIEAYGTKIRFAENAPLVNDKEKKIAIPKEVQAGLDVYATYYLALAHLERNNVELAELEFKNTLKLLPEPGPNQPYYSMFRRGANTNLGRIYEAKKNSLPGHCILHPARPHDPVRGQLDSCPRAGLERSHGSGGRAAPFGSPAKSRPREAHGSSAVTCGSHAESDRRETHGGSRGDCNPIAGSRPVIGMMSTGFCLRLQSSTVATTSLRIAPQNTQKVDESVVFSVNQTPGALPARAEFCLARAGGARCAIYGTRRGDCSVESAVARSCHRCRRRFQPLLPS